MKFYRYKEQATSYCSYDFNGEPYHDPHQLPDIKLLCNEYILIKETAKGYWIKEDKYYIESKYWVSKTSKKRFAYPTKEEALFGFIKRKETQIRILKDRLYIAETGKRIAEGKDQIYLTELHENNN